MRKFIYLFMLMLVLQFAFSQKASSEHRVPPRAVALFQKALLMKGSSVALQKKRIRLFKRCIEIDHQFFEAIVNVSIAYLNLAKPEKALPYATRAFRMKPDSLKANIYYCEALERAGHYKEALKVLGGARALFPSNMDLLQCLVRVKYALKKWDDVLGILSTNEQLKEIQSMREIYVFSLIRLKRWNDATAFLTNPSYSLQKEDPSFFYHILYYIGKDSGRYHLAIQACMDALCSTISVKDKKYFLNALSHMGLKLPIGEQLKKVYAKYKNLIMKDTSLSLNWARSLAASGFLNDAKGLLSKEIRMKKAPLMAYVLLCNILLHEKDYTQLNTVCSQGLSTYPNGASLYYFKGVALMKKADFAGALEYFKKSYLLKNSAVTLLALQMAAIKGNKLDFAIDASKSFLKKEANNDSIRFNFAMLECLAGKCNDALSDLEKAVRSRPEKWVPVLEQEVKAVHSVFDCIRYKARFAELLKLKIPENKK